MLNRKQFPKARKKRAVDPNAPPRPNLLSQDKKLRETVLKLDQQQETIANLNNELVVANRKIRYLENQIDVIFSALRSRRNFG